MWLGKGLPRREEDADGPGSAAELSNPLSTSQMDKRHLTVHI